MSTVWGQLIDREILSNQMLTYCLKLLVTMLGKSVTSRFYRFGIDVLDRCKTKLKDYSSFCQWIVLLQTFPQFPRILKEYIEYGTHGLLPTNQTASGMASLMDLIQMFIKLIIF
jgi:CCR4-NOT transcription complex subunit 1